VKPLAGQHALVTGANRGIGAAIARHLARAGADVSLLVRTPANAEPLALELQAFGARTAIVAADVTDAHGLARAIGEAVAALGPVDILVNNAGTAETVPFHRTDDAVFDRMLAVHLMAPVHAVRAVLPSMLERGRGRVVNIASVAGLTGGPYITAYVSAKHAMVGFTRALAAEYRDTGVLFNAVCPGYTDTDMVSGAVTKVVAKTGIAADAAVERILRDSGQQRLATVDEVAEATVAFSLPSCTVSGETQLVMGGTA
jgi:NAD(P)-dependent dehydrogenase (short-subunit alcohol dehydrogenase family)